jgi:hypothetical protein
MPRTSIFLGCHGLLSKGLNKEINKLNFKFLKIDAAI